MNKSFSLYLDIARFMAALCVVLAHFNQHQVVGHELARFIPELGREAVMVFFVLSGYVIAYTVTAKHQSLKEYAVARFARIYSVAFPVMLLAFVLKYFDEAYFAPVQEFSYQLARPYIYIPFHSLFLGERWNISETPPWLEPYWSLGYEVWYYVFFAALFYFSGYKRIIIGTVVFLTLGYKLWLLLPVWFSGVALFHNRDRFALTVRQARLIWSISILLLCGYKFSGINEYLRHLGMAIWPFKLLILGTASRYLADYVVCLIVLINFYSARFSRFSALDSFSTPIRGLSAYTFTLYLVHMLVIWMWLSLAGHDHTKPMDIVSLSVLIALSTYLIGAVTERKKAWFAAVFSRLLEYAELLLTRIVGQFRQSHTRAD
jgi:peptidoglycan/LPS O-acetylase OafA/YrhL